MALRIELWENGTLVDGIEDWWDDVEAALSTTSDSYPILHSISPYGEQTIPPNRVRDLATEAHDLAGKTTGHTSKLLRKLARLSERAAEAPSAELRFDGD
jgi:hypothetical protein